MIFVLPRNRGRWIPSKTRSNGLSRNGIFFLCVLCFLVFWSFWGRGIEEWVYDQPSLDYNFYGNVGATIMVSQAPGNMPVIRIISVASNSPAARAGLKPEDRVIGIDGRILSSADMAWHILGSMGTEKTHKWTVEQNGKNRSVYITLNDRSKAAGILRNKALNYSSLSTVKKVIITLLFLKFSIVLFYLLNRKIENRTLIVGLFATKFVLIGSFLGVYNPLDAFFAIKFNTISLLLGMSIITVVLDEAGFFKRVAQKISGYAGESSLRLLICFCLVTYFFSLLVNNLTTILVIVPITLKLAASLRFDPRPFIVGEVIASNLGGASTMVGDFPNMLIASQAGIGFGRFVIFMMPICLILLGLMLLYLKPKIGKFSILKTGKTPQLENPAPGYTRAQRRALRRGLFVLGHVIFLFIISGMISLDPSAVALIGATSLFLFSGLDRRKIMRGVGFNDILFFAGLFVVVGALEASGVLNYISGALETFSLGRPWLLCLVLMWAAALLTAFLNAGPAAALFFPVVMGCAPAPSHDIVWWALSLGILAGSSATIFGATAGPVAVTLLEKFSVVNHLNFQGGNTISFRQFSETGLPLMLIFLSVSSVYVTFLCHYL